MSNVTRRRPLVKVFVRFAKITYNEYDNHKQGDCYETVDDDPDGPIYLGSV